VPINKRIGASSAAVAIVARDEILSWRMAITSPMAPS